MEAYGVIVPDSIAGGDGHISPEEFYDWLDVHIDKHTKEMHKVLTEMNATEVKLEELRVAHRPKRKK
jgi:hypothetical protein